MHLEIDTTKVTAAQLRAAADIREKADGEIAALLGDTPAPGKRRGRPAGKLAQAKAKKKGGKRKISPEGRARIAEAQRRRWKKQKAGK